MQSLENSWEYQSVRNINMLESKHWYQVDLYFFRSHNDEDKVSSSQRSQMRLKSDLHTGANLKDLLGYTNFGIFDS